MILQGGDLFHINKPTRKSMYEVITAIRGACLGDKPCELELMNQVDLGLEEEYVIQTTRAFARTNFLDSIILIMRIQTSMSRSRFLESAETTMMPQE